MNTVKENILKLATLTDSSDLLEKEKMKEYLQKNMQAMNQQIERPQLEILNPDEAELRLFITDLDSYNDTPLQHLQRKLGNVDECSVVRLFGINESRNSFCCHIYNCPPFSTFRCRKK